MDTLQADERGEASRSLTVYYLSVASAAPSVLPYVLVTMSKGKQRGVHYLLLPLHSTCRHTRCWPRHEAMLTASMAEAPAQLLPEK